MDRRLPPEFLQQVQEGCDVVEVISGYVALKKSGQNFTGLCPFHAEKTPSFTVSPSKRLFYCFGCSAGGSAITFLMKIEGLTFPEAVRQLGGRLGLALPQRAQSSREMDRKNRLRQLLERAAARFHEQLLSHPGAAEARAYVADRHLSESTIAEFGLGYALPGWEDMLSTMTRQGWTAQELLDVGLVVRRRDGSGYYDRFRGRVIFPIRDLQGHVVGFGARVLDESLPKYLNSPDTLFYSKGRVLFGFDRARAAASREGSLIVVEGYFDAIAAHQAGVRQVVATLGTALTETHVTMIQRLVPRVVLLFDPDPAGVRATLRTVELFCDHGLHASVATLPDGVDPDSFIRQHGIAVFEERVASARPLLEYTIERALSCTPHDQISGKMAVVESLLPTLRKIQSRLELDHYLRMLTQRLSVSEASLRADLARAGISADSRGKLQSAPAVKPASENTLAVWAGEEKILLHLWFHRKVETIQLVEMVRPEEFAHPTAQALMRLICEATARGNADPVQRVVEWASADEALAAAVANLSLLEMEYDSVSRALEECVAKLRRRRLDQRIRQLEEARQAAEREGNDARARELQVAILQSRRTLDIPPPVDDSAYSRSAGG